jgi:hypothetical protein
VCVSSIPNNATSQTVCTWHSLDIRAHPGLQTRTPTSTRNCSMTSAMVCKGSVEVSSGSSSWAAKLSYDRPSSVTMACTLGTVARSTADSWKPRSLQGRGGGYGSTRGGGVRGE